MQFTDSHCHLDDEIFKEQLTSLLTQCQQRAIHRIIIPSIAPSNFKQVLTLCQKHHEKPIQLHPCLGIHPWFLTDLTNQDLDLLTKKVQQTRKSLIGLGEIGIDGTIAKQAENPDENLAKQRHFFDFQLNLAKEQGLPVIIHHRQSHDQIIPFLKKYQLEKLGVIHGFSGSYQQAKSYLDLGYKLGVGSTITYSRAQKTINTIKRLPLTSLVLETDAPSMPVSKEILTAKNEQKEGSLIGNSSLSSLNSPLNSPSNLIQIFETLVSIRPESSNEIALAIEENIERVFFS